jgi:predicted membrane chloride channel (bestrophin family)
MHFSPKYFVPRSERSNSKGLFRFETSGEEKLFRVNRYSPTRELNFTHRNWEAQKSVWRRLRHMKTLFTSDSFQRLAFPDLFITASTAAAISSYNTFIATDVTSQLLLDGSVTAGATTAVGLLAAFRLNGSYGRYEEGRKFWGEINNASRDLAGNAVMWLESQEDKDRMLKLIKAFPVSMQWHLNDKGGHYIATRKDGNFQKQMDAEFHAEMSDIFQNGQDHDFLHIIDAFQNKSHGPLGIISAMRSIISDNMTWVDPIYNREMDARVQQLVGCIGMCERVLRTPIPTCFTRHTSRLMFLWSNLLPFAMYGACGPIWTLPASVMVSYALLGIEDIGVQLEEPFNILPLRQYSEGIYTGVDDIQNSFYIRRKRKSA